MASTRRLWTERIIVAMSEPDTPERAPDRRQVCVVDDDPDIRESLRFFFEEAGYHVEEVGDGIGALRFLEAADHPWVVLLDRMMPHMDGIAVLRALADLPHVASRAPIVYLTARSDAPDPETARMIASHTVATATKPFNLDALLDAVERASKQLAERDVLE